jgi:hypothetical protein
MKAEHILKFSIPENSGNKCGKICEVEKLDEFEINAILKRFERSNTTI